VLERRVVASALSALDSEYRRDIYSFGQPDHQSFASTALDRVQDCGRTECDLKKGVLVPLKTRAKRWPQLPPFVALSTSGNGLNLQVQLPRKAILSDLLQTLLDLLELAN